MLDSNTILMQVKSGTAPADWRVLRAKSSHFINTGLLYAGIGLAIIAYLVYLRLSNSILVFGGADTSTPQAQMFWFWIDIIIGGVLALGALGWSAMNLVELGSAQDQMLVLLPDGFVMQTNKPQTVAYGAVEGMTMTPKSGEVNLVMRRADNGAMVKVTLDGRFGAPKPIAQAIMSAQAHYAQARAMAMIEKSPGSW